MVVLVMTATPSPDTEPLHHPTEVLHQPVSPLRFDERHVEREVARRLASRRRPEFSQRALALMLDVVALETSSVAVWHLGGGSSGLSFLTTLLVGWFLYLTVSLTLSGRTVGQHIMGLRVVPDTDDAPGAGLGPSHVSRLVVAAGINLATAGGFVLLAPAGHRSGRRMWHERFSGTVVIRTMG